MDKLEAAIKDEYAAVMSRIKKVLKAIDKRLAELDKEVIDIQKELKISNYNVTAKKKLNTPNMQLSINTTDYQDRSISYESYYLKLEVDDIPSVNVNQLSAVLGELILIDRAYLKDWIKELVDITVGGMLNSWRK